MLQKGANRFHTSAEHGILQGVVFDMIPRFYIRALSEKDLNKVLYVHILRKALGRACQKLIDHPTPLSRRMPKSRTQVTAAENCLTSPPSTSSQSDSSKLGLTAVLLRAVYHIGDERSMSKQRRWDCGEKTRGGWESVVVNG